MIETCTTEKQYLLLQTSHIPALRLVEESQTLHAQMKAVAVISLALFSILVAEGAHPVSRRATHMERRRSTSAG